MISCYTSTTAALWYGTNKNRDVNTGPLARPFARSLAPSTALTRLLTSLTPSLVGKGMIRWLFLAVFFPIFDHSALVTSERSWFFPESGDIGIGFHFHVIDEGAEIATLIRRAEMRTTRVPPTLTRLHQQEDIRIYGIEEKGGKGK